MATRKGPSQPRFRFSPRPNRAREIRWQEWGPQAFEEARRQDKPILLSLSAVWCHWCHVMDETTYSDEAVIQYINDRFVPVRVDNDQRPDINLRYNMGGWPTTAFLTPDGEILTGATYLPPERMRELLPQLAAYYQGNRAQIQERIQEIVQQRRAGAGIQPGALDERIFDEVLRAVSDAYDPVYGGFDDAPKFPHSDAIDLLHLRLSAPPRPGHPSHGPQDAGAHGRRRRLRPGVGRLLPLRHQSRLERPPLREDAGGQRAPPVQLPPPLPGHRRAVRRPGGEPHHRLPGRPPLERRPGLLRRQPGRRRALLHV